MKIFLTGGTGFIGKNLVSILLKNGHEIVSFAKTAENLDNPSHTSVIGDICDSSAVEKAMAGCDTVVNLAAESSAGRSMEDPKSFMSTNYTGTFVLIEAARKLGIKKFFQMSTDQVYGNCETDGFTETAPLNPTNPYSATKAAADLLVLSYFRTFKFPVVVARSSIVFGPHQYPEKLLPRLIISAIRNKPLTVYNDGLYYRQWIYVEDTCQAIMVLLEKGIPGEIYNIEGSEHTNLEVVESVLSLLGKPSSLITNVKDDKFYDRRYSVNAEKLKSLGWKPKFSFEQAMKATVDWYGNNEAWWSSLV